MGELSALSALGVTILLALTRPRFGGLAVGPALAALAGFLLMAWAGHVTLGDIAEAFGVLWHAIVAIASIMIIAASAVHLGVVSRLADAVMLLGAGSVRKLFLLVFCLSTCTAAILNNDSAILVLTPLVILMIRQLYPDRPDLLVPFAFAVFLAAGVAPVVTSNPINLIVSDVADLDFNEYAVLMLPVALVSAALTFVAARWIFASELGLSAQARLMAPEDRSAAVWAPRERHGLWLTLLVLGTYPVVAYFGGSVWIVAVTGAVAACGLCWYHDVVRPDDLVRRGVAWEILIFLFGVYVLAIGLRNAGAVDWLIAVYSPPDIMTIGIVSAVGSALINNHSMALTNIVAIGALEHGGRTIHYLAALVGGDLGPRFLPIGSLAGLLWYAALERMNVHVPILQFIKVGVIVTIPSLFGGLLMLQFMAG